MLLLLASVLKLHRRIPVRCQRSHRGRECYPRTPHVIPNFILKGSVVATRLRRIPFVEAFATWLPAVMLVAIGTTLMLSVAPPFRGVPGRDSGVFLYVASML